MNLKKYTNGLQLSKLSTLIRGSDNENNNALRNKKKKSFLRRCCGPFCDFFTAEPENHRLMKMFLGFPFGGLFGFGLYNLVILPMDLSQDTRQLVGAVMVFGIASGFALSVGVRCVCILLVPTFMGKAGRSYIGTFAIAYLIAGPIENIVTNAQDITRSLTCAAELAANQTVVKFKFKMMPIGNVLKDMQAEGYLLGKIGHRVNRAFLPIRKEIKGEEGVAEMEARTAKEDKIEGGKINRAATVNAETKSKADDEEAVKITNKYKKKAEFKCEDTYNAAVRKCRGVFNKLERKCRNALPPLIDELCVVVNFGFVCNIVKVIGKAVGGECNADKFIDPSFGKVYKASENSIDNLDEGMEVNVQYKIVQTKEDIDYTSVEEMRSNTMHEFKQSRASIEFVFVIIKRFLGFTFLLVVMRSHKYYKRYTTDLRFDNIYITSYFRKVDARRKLQGKRVLLPLKRSEKGDVVFPANPKLMKLERSKLGNGTFLVMTRALLAGMIFFVAHALYSVMDIIRRHSRVDFKQAGVNHINIKIGGTGFMSNIVRLFMNGLNVKHSLDHVTSNLDCLPQPEEVDKKYYVYVFGVYATIWLLILLDAYGLRLRRTVTAFFFRKREKARVLHLYNQMMKKRKFYHKETMRKIKRKAKKLQLSAKSGVIYSLRRQFPRLCVCLAIFKSSKSKCLICDEVETKTFQKCNTPGCEFVYCAECWIDVKNVCYACLPLCDFCSEDTDDDLNSSDDD